MPRAIPVQARAKARYDSIVGAAEIHYAEVGHDDFNLDAVAALAGCSVATIYRYFDDRLDLLDVVAPQRNEAERKLLKIQELIPDVTMTDAQKWRLVEIILTND